MTANHDNDPLIPEELTADLRAVFTPSAIDTAQLDQRIQAGVEQQLGSPRRGNRLITTRWPLAAAAGLLLAVTLWALRPTPRQGPTPLKATQITHDVDANGRIDILDAFIVARALDHNQPTSPAWDVNADGAVDHADVTNIAQAAVSLTEEQG